MGQNRRDFIKRAGLLGVCFKLVPTTMEATEKVEATPVPKSPQPKPIVVETIPERVAVEREIRRYVRRDGDFRKDLARGDRERATTLLKLMGRKKVIWDTTIRVGGFESCEVGYCNSFAPKEVMI